MRTFEYRVFADFRLFFFPCLHPGIDFYIIVEKATSSPLNGQVSSVFSALPILLLND